GGQHADRIGPKAQFQALILGRSGRQGESIGLALQRAVDEALQGLLTYLRLRVTTERQQRGAACLVSDLAQGTRRRRPHLGRLLFVGGPRLGLSERGRISRPAEALSGQGTDLRGRIVEEVEERGANVGAAPLGEHLEGFESLVPVEVTIL